MSFVQKQNTTVDKLNNHKIKKEKKKISKKMRKKTIIHNETHEKNEKKIIEIKTAQKYVQAKTVKSIPIKV